MNQTNTAERPNPFARCAAHAQLAHACCRRAGVSLLPPRQQGNGNGQRTMWRAHSPPARLPHACTCCACGCRPDSAKGLLQLKRAMQRGQRQTFIFCALASVICSTQPGSTQPGSTQHSSWQVHGRAGLHAVQCAGGLPMSACPVIAMHAPCRLPPHLGALAAEPLVAVVAGDPEVLHPAAGRGGVCVWGGGMQGWAGACCVATWLRGMAACLRVHDDTHAASAARPAQAPPPLKGCIPPKGAHAPVFAAALGAGLAVAVLPSVIPVIVLITVVIILQSHVT